MLARPDTPSELLKNIKRAVDRVLILPPEFYCDEVLVKTSISEGESEATQRTRAAASSSRDETRTTVTP